MLKYIIVNNIDFYVCFYTDTLSKIFLDMGHLDRLPSVGCLKLAVL